MRNTPVTYKATYRCREREDGELDVVREMVIHPVDNFGAIPECAECGELMSLVSWERIEEKK